MNYRDYLTNMRETPYTIQPRKLNINSTQQEPADLMEFSRTWIAGIKEASAEINKTSQDRLDKRKAEKAAKDAEAEAKKVELQEADEKELRPLIKPNLVLRGVVEPDNPSFKDGAGSFLEVMDRTEGGGNYDTLFAHSQNSKFSGVKVSEMTIGELKRFSASNGEYGQWVKGKLRESGQKARVATPMGRFQFVGTTMAEVASEMNLPDDTVFDRTTQDAMFSHLLHKKISSAKTLDGKVNNLRDTWEGFKGVPRETLERLVNRYEET